MTIYILHQLTSKLVDAGALVQFFESSHKFGHLTVKRSPHRQLTAARPFYSICDLQQHIHTTSCRESMGFKEHSTLVFTSD